MNIVIVGMGSIGKRYFKNIKKYFKSHKVFDWKLIKNTNIKIDSAIICNPSSYHVKTAIEFAKKKIHCLIEKPLSLNLKDIKKLQDLSKKNKLNIQVGYNLRFMKGAKYLKNEINKQNKIYHISVKCLSDLRKWRKNPNFKKFSSAYQKLNGGVVFELSHEIDYLRWIFGEIKKVFAVNINSKKLKLDIDGVSHMFLEFQSGATADIHLSLISNTNKRECKIISKKGIFFWNLLKDKITKNNKIIFKNDKYDINQTQISQLKNFFNAIKEKTNQPMVNLDDAIKTLKVLLAIKNFSSIR